MLPNETTMRDDVTGEALMQRGDDKPEALKKRLTKYHSETVPVLNHYEPKGVVSRINGDQKPSQVWADIEAVLPATRF